MCVCVCVCVFCYLPRVITNFFRHTGGYNKWQKVTRQQSDRRYAESIAALQSGLNSGPQSATSSITNAVHHALQEAQVCAGMELRCAVMACA